jgi:hypothetical protein
MRDRRPHLRVLASTEPAPALRAPSSPSLTSAPFRPGELPTTSWIPLDRATRELVCDHARDAALPTELWVRIAVEASRIASEISLLSGCTRREVIAQLDQEASRKADQSQLLGASELRRYATALRMGHPAPEAGEVLTLRLPEEISGAWNAEASAARLDLPRWIASALETAPAQCVIWEASAAATCRSLGEWSYASWLRASASAKA